MFIESRPSHSKNSMKIQSIHNLLSNPADTQTDKPRQEHNLLAGGNNIKQIRRQAGLVSAFHTDYGTLFALDDIQC